MKRVSIAIVALCFLTSHLLAQRSGYPNPYGNSLSRQEPGVRQNTDGSICFPSPWYDTCIYDYHPYSLDLYRVWPFYTVWNGVPDNDIPRPTLTHQALETPPTPPPPVKPVSHEYDWPKEVNAPATFSIVTTNGTEYLATMVWVQDSDVHFTSVDGGVHQLPLSSISMPLTQTANARKNLSLHLP